MIEWFEVRVNIMGLINNTTDVMVGITFSSTTTNETINLGMSKTDAKRLRDGLNLVLQELENSQWDN